MNSLRKAFSSTYQSVSDRSSSSGGNSNRSNHNSPNLPSQTILTKELSSSTTLLIESGPTDVKVKNALLQINHCTECLEKTAFWTLHKATVYENGASMEFDLEPEKLKQHAYCSYVLKAIIDPKNPLPAQCHYIITVRGKVQKLVPLVGNRALLDLTAEKEMHHGNGEQILKGLFWL